MFKDDDYVNYYDKFIGDQIDSEKLCEKLRLSIKTCDNEKIYFPFQSMEGGRFVREGHDDIYELWFLKELIAEENATSAECAMIWRIMRGFPKSPLIPSTVVNGIVCCNEGAFIDYVKSVFECSTTYSWEDDCYKFVLNGGGTVDKIVDGLAYPYQCLDGICRE